MFEFSRLITTLGGCVVASVLFFLMSTPLLGVIQQQGYDGKRFFAHYVKSGNAFRRRMSIIFFALALPTAIVALSFSMISALWGTAVSALPFMVMSIFYLVASGKHALKVPLKRTPRMIRLAVCYFILLVGITFGFSCAMLALAEVVGSETFTAIVYVPVCTVPLVFFVLIFVANFITSAYELPRNKSYIRRAQKVLDGATYQKVGVTGSYGKTSVKLIAKTILSEKFTVEATPLSYNTPIGIASFVNAGVKDCDVCIFEMGARKTGDIDELLELVKPTFGVLTGVCDQHLASFGSLEAIKKEKGKLPEYCPSVLGKGVEGEGMVWGKDYGVENVEVSFEGTSFTLVLGGEKLPVKTKLLGVQSAENVALASALAYKLGMTVEEIARGIEKLEPVPHRLQLLEGDKLHVLDDSYNSNVVGAKEGLEVFKCFPNKKIVVTPGLVELGDLEENENFTLGENLVGFDKIYLVGETRVLAVRRGYLANGGDEEKLVVVPTLEKAVEELITETTVGDSVYFLNDLPDCFAL